MAKFYEGICLSRLEYHCIKFNFPPAIFRLAISSYQSARPVCLAGYVSGPFYAMKGVIAGCSFATSFVKVYTFDAFADIEYPSNVSVDQYTGDSAVSAVGSVSEVVH
eukprot:5180164-Pyramimonas_sp.AAC.1